MNVPLQVIGICRHCGCDVIDGSTDCRRCYPRDMVFEREMRELLAKKAKQEDEHQH